MLYVPTISQKCVSKIWIKLRFYPYHPLVHTTGVFGRKTKTDRFFGDGKGVGGVPKQTRKTKRNSASKRDLFWDGE